jgi:hypothetical protein
MKAMSKFWMALVVGVAVMAITVPSWAGPVPEVPSSDAQGWIGPLSATLTSTFTGGIVTSWVFNAAGAAAGHGFVYVYQVKNTFTKSKDPNIDNISFDLLGPIVTNPNLPYDKKNKKTLTTFAFQFDELEIGKVKIKGNKTLTDATLASPVTFSFDKGEPGLEPGQTSMLFAFFSPAPPTTIDATINFIDKYRNSQGSTTARVLTPSPEASVGVMFGLGLLGLPFFRKLRRRFTK